MARDLDAYRGALSEYLALPGTNSILNQAHARRIMVELGTSPDEFPNFSENLDERLHYGASYLIAGGLDLLDDEQHRNQAQAFLFAGAEALEFLVGSRETYRGSYLDERLRAAAAYYLAGYHARAFVILNDPTYEVTELGAIEQIVASLLKQDVRGTYDAIVRVFADARYSDAGIAQSVRDNSLDLDEVISRACIRSLAGAVGLYLEFLRTGDELRITEARQVVTNIRNLASESRFVDIWWWVRVVEKLLDEIRGTSLWTTLNPISPAGDNNSLVRGYILGCLQRNICTLWPSQISAIKKVAEPERRSFCVKMPTSAGKTRIAELAILTAFKDSPEASPKCIYIAPFRSLAIEVERSLRAAFGPLGFTVSELYGGSELSEAEAEVIESVNVIVATPEKLDAMVRFSPEILNSVKCVVVDEGHTAGETSERGLKAEFVLNRLLRKLPRDQCRYVFVSAVLPNAEDFARWISGGEDGLISSDWRPSRQLVGNIEWKGGRGQIVYTHVSNKPFETKCFVPRFLEQIVYRPARTEKLFPADRREALSLSAIKLSVQGAVLIFVPQRRWVESSAEDVLKAMELEKALNPNAQVSHLEADISLPAVADCLAAIEKELGAASIIGQCVAKGIAIHHGHLPWPIRKPMERFINSGQASIIVATTTLAAGVNLPIRSVLVKGLQQSQHKTVDSLTFWNICGRAGRGMKEIEGQILFFVDFDDNATKVARAQKLHRELVETPNTRAILGVLYLLLREVKERWNKCLPQVSFEDICLKLANNDLAWSKLDKRGSLEPWFEYLDDQLFALHCEQMEEGELADLLQEILQDSLLSIQLASKPIEGLDLKAASRVLIARLNYVKTQVPEKTERSNFYKLALPLESCLLVAESTDMLTALLSTMTEWSTKTTEERMEWLDLFIDWAITLPFMELEEKYQGAEVHLARSWILGASLQEMAADPFIAGIWDSPQEVGFAVEQFCGFRLAWLANAVVTYCSAKKDEEIILPSTIEALPGMFKYGTLVPLATTFAPMLDSDRALAEALAPHCPHHFGDKKVFAWFRSLTRDDLSAFGVDEELSEKIIECRNHIFSVGKALDFEEEWDCFLEPLGSFALVEDEVVVTAIRSEFDGHHCIMLNQFSGRSIGRFIPIDQGIDPDWFQWNVVQLKYRLEEGVHILRWNRLR